jgi:glycosyltransferase involved in cell wall biosynthesis
MEIDNVLEHFALSFGLTEQAAFELLDQEVAEIRKAEGEEALISELHDAYYALYNLAVVKLGRAVRFDHKVLADKVKSRLRQFGTIAKKEPHLSESAVSTISFHVIHFAFGTFRLPWQRFDPFKNGTEAEIADCTDKHKGNHLIVTFDATDQLTATFLCSSFSRDEGNTVLLRIPDWLFNHARERRAYDSLAPYLAAQVQAGLDQIRIADSPIFHFHSWESGFLVADVDFPKTGYWIFSPYLTVGRLLELIRARGSGHWTLPLPSAEFAANWEAKLCRACDDVLVESTLDWEFYSRGFGQEKVRKVNFLRTPDVHISKTIDGEEIHLVAGGRAVSEKGFDLLIQHFHKLQKDARFAGRKLKLTIFCREKSRKTGKIKYPDHLALLEELRNGNPDIEIRDKVSEGELREFIRRSHLLIVPSVFDPFCLMPQYAWEASSLCLISRHAGISELIEDERFVFEPEDYEDFAKKLQALMDRPIDFHLTVPEKTRSVYPGAEPAVVSQA